MSVTRTVSCSGRRRNPHPGLRVFPSPCFSTCWWIRNSRWPVKTLNLAQCISIWTTAPSRSSQRRPSSGNYWNSSMVNVPSGAVQRPTDSLVNSVGRRDRLSLLHLDLKGVLWPPAQVERAVGGHLVQPLVLRGVRRLLHHFRRLSGLLGDLA